MQIEFQRQVDHAKSLSDAGRYAEAHLAYRVLCSNYMTIPESVIAAMEMCERRARERQPRDPADQ